MRIIAGEFRGRRLLAPTGSATRPITDRAKQSLFDILAPLVPQARVYDCFAGTGSMGLECLSRGAEHVAFFESDREALAQLRKNLESLGVTGRATVVSQDLFAFFTTADRLAAGLDLPPAKLVFLDPPYRYVSQRPDALARLASQLSAGRLAPDAVVVFRHGAADRLELTPLVRYDQREYGGMTIEFLRIP